MAENRKAWKSAIEKALKQKGFTKSGAKKTAKIVIRKSIAKKRLMLDRKLRDKESQPAPVYQKKPAPPCAISKPSSMAGKIVVVPPKPEGLDGG
jgi:hypothetical protein